MWRGREASLEAAFIGYLEEATGRKATRRRLGPLLR